MKLFFISLFILSINGCSNKAIYENIQINQKNKCMELPQSQQDQCIEKANKSYAEYERERRENLDE